MTEKQFAAIAAYLGVSVGQLQAEADAVLAEHIRELPSFKKHVSKRVGELLLMLDKEVPDVFRAS